MRHQLMPLENKLVLIRGWFKEHRKQNDSAHLLLSNARVHVLNPNTAYMKSNSLFTLDHLWVTESGAENTKGRELFTKVFFVGRVKPYIRTNKSKDYGVVAEPFQDLDKILYQVSWKVKQIREKPTRQSIKHKAEMQLYSNLLDSITNTNTHFVGINTSTNEWIETYKDLLNKATMRYNKAYKTECKQNKKQKTRIILQRFNKGFS